MVKSILFILILACCSMAGISQEYVLRAGNPFQIQLVSQDSTWIALKYLFADRDRDGDQDLFEIGFTWDTSGFNTIFNMMYHIEYQENIGTQQQAMYAPQVEPFNNFSFPNGTFSPSIGDLNNDGYLDIIAAGQVDTMSGQVQLVMYLNTGAPEGQFNKVLAEDYALPPLWPKSIFTPEITDLDMDGDPDILLSAYIPINLGNETYTDLVLYAKNIGTGVSPDFLGWFDTPYGLTQDSVYELMKTGDIDGDGDMDILTISAGLDTITPIAFYRNSPGANGKPAFESKVLSPFGLPGADMGRMFLDLNLVDIDHDQDLDVFVLSLDTTGSLFMDYYENIACTTQHTSISEQICEGETYLIGGMEFSTPGVYSVTLVGSNECDSIVELTLDVLPAYELFLNEQLCNGDVYVIGTEEFTTSGDYTVVLITAEGCDSIINASLQFESVDITVTQDAQMLTASLADALYQWLDCTSGFDISGATDKTYVPDVSGSYAVRITDSFGCVGISACYEVVISAVTDPALQDSVFICPNPATDHLWIRNLSGISASGAWLYSGSGNLIRSLNISSDESIRLTDIDSGVYFLKIDFNGKTVIQKIIVIAF